LLNVVPEFGVATKDSYMVSAKLHFQRFSQSGIQEGREVELEA
jgi:hypothetical protein